MRRWWGALALLGLAGCGLVREAPVEQPAPFREDGLPSSALEHPRTLAWTRRFCDKLTRRSAAEIGLAPARPILPQMKAILVASTGFRAALSAVPAIESRYQPLARGDPRRARPLAAPARHGAAVGSRGEQGRATSAPTSIARRRARPRYLGVPPRPLRRLAARARRLQRGRGPRRSRARAAVPARRFWDLAERGALPQISREYVPKILAVVRVTGDPAACAELTRSARPEPRQNRGAIAVELRRRAMRSGIWNAVDLDRIARHEERSDRRVGDIDDHVTRRRPADGGPPPRRVLTGRARDARLLEARQPFGGGPLAQRSAARGLRARRRGCGARPPCGSAGRRRGRAHRAPCRTCESGRRARRRRRSDGRPASSNAWNGAMFGWRVPRRPGSSPVTRCRVSAFSRIASWQSNMATSTIAPRPVSRRR